MSVSYGGKKTQGANGETAQASWLTAVGGETNGLNAYVVFFCMFVPASRREELENSECM